MNAETPKATSKQKQQAEDRKQKGRAGMRNET
jgi:hypothetical protein